MVTNSPVRVALAAAVLALALVVVPGALAGKGGKSGGAAGSNTFSLVMVSDQNGNGLPDWGDSVSFTASTSATTSPSVSLTCYQGGVAVLWGDGNYYLGNTVFPLQSGMWTSGAADCTATLYYLSGGKTVTLATKDFVVGA